MTPNHAVNSDVPVKVFVPVDATGGTPVTWFRQAPMSKRARTPLDADGLRVRVGDLVRIVGVPDLSGMERTARLESEPVFRYIQGKYKRILGFDINGMAELSFAIRNGPLSGRHWVAIEPRFVRIHHAKPGA